MGKFERFAKVLSSVADPFRIVGGLSERQYDSVKEWSQRNFPYHYMSDDVNVTHESSLAVSYVYSAVNAISSDIASLYWSVYKTVEDRDRKFTYELKDHDQYEILNKKAYFAYNSTTFFRAWVMNYLLTGDGFAEIVRNEVGRPTGYRLYHKKDIEIYLNHDTQSKIYKILCEDGREVDHMDMLHLSDMSFDGLFGYSKVGLARKSIEIAKRSDSTQNNLQKSGTYLGGVIEFDKVLTPEQAESFRKSFKDVYGGTQGEVAVLDAGAKFTPFQYSMTMADAEFLTSRKYTGEEILRFFRFPAHMANSLDRATNNNIEHLSLEYVNYTLRPTVELIENELNNKIFRPSEVKDHFVKGNLNSLLRGDIESRTALYETLWKVGALSANDALLLEGMNPVPNGDIRYSDLNKMPSSQVIDYYQAKIDQIKDSMNAQ